MYDRISFFGMPIKTLGSLGKIRVGRVTGNTHIFFFGLSINEPRSEKTGLQGFRPGPTETGLYCHRRWLEA